LKFPEITSVRTDLPAIGISLGIISVKKSKKHHIRHLAAEILTLNPVVPFRFLLFIDDLIDLTSDSEIVWMAANNLDPMRDCFYIESSPGVKIPALCMDATRKSGKFDDFRRDWPNVIVMDQQTINAVDQKWPQLDLGPPILSPSLHYKSLNNSSEAIFSEDF
jgi:4-hydroxy-3-polyprenylbenzoate decarboxylase